MVKELLTTAKRLTTTGWTKQLWRFSGVGLISTAIHSSVALTAIKVMDFNATKANVCGFFVALLCSYSMHAIWSFEQNVQKNSFIRFLIVGLINLFIIVNISRLNEALDYPAEVSVLVLACLIPIINFCIHKFWTFSQ